MRYKLFLLLFTLLSITSSWSREGELEKRINELLKIYNKRSEEFLSLTGKSPILIKDLIARRFINLPDWTRFVLQAEKEGREVDIRKVYNPAPLTWDSWQKTALGVVQEDINNRSTLSFNTLRSWHQSSLTGELGRGMRTGRVKISSNYGANIYRNWSLSPTEIQNLKKFKFTHSPKTKLEWTNLKCREEIISKQNELNSQFPILNTKQCRKTYFWSTVLGPFSKFWREAHSNIKKNDLFDEDNYHNHRWFWYNCWPREKKRNLNRYCGMIHYPKPRKAKRVLKKILSRINQFFKEKGPKTNYNSYKVIKLALQTQREVAALHPFLDGNGRISRFLMDYITLRAGIPTLFIPDMNNDISSSFESVLHWGVQSLEETNRIILEATKFYVSQTFDDFQRSRYGLVREF